MVVDRIVKGSDRSRLHDSLETALKLSDGLAVVTIMKRRFCFPAIIPVNTAASTFRSWSRGCFSPSMPFGACDHRKGTWHHAEGGCGLSDPGSHQVHTTGGIIYYKNIVGTENLEWQRFKAMIDYYKIDIDKPIKDPKKKRTGHITVWLSKDPISYRLATRSGNVMKKTEFIEVYVL